MNDLKFRKLFASEIDCRVSTVTKNGCSILLYKDARVDQRLLDETVGTFNWQRSHEVINGNLFCNVGIWIDRRGEGFGEWVWKQDVGKESYTEKEKGQASDAFKRACFNWGIGRELYTAPFIWIDADNDGVEIQSKGGKYTTYSKFKLASIGYKGDSISYLKITCKGHIVYEQGDPTSVYTAENLLEDSETPAEVAEEEEDARVTEEVREKHIDSTKIKVLDVRCKERNVKKHLLCRKYGVKDFSEITEEQFLEIANKWEDIVKSCS